ncbi:hypothetical protein H5085_09010 [Pseudoalteromonas sp. SR43-6]|uniref:hypothetical protein n=1 Tax=unclassified Pseudoalteromonas TaxID=194690 RepID=UPI0015FAFD7E|nr:MULTISPECIES: hypothetical protein [unclassified Pseudoalteromonas]MBB1288323.1 hypothetical protein [Pseudoalteromonas sp. SR41-5]MBB1374460.1 hypothetical protein [Pseudoalteromonas sp. SR43-6]MBB1413342.1 hypothetical protein [Pseudoalteromonas sp. SG43-8]
MSKYKQLLVLLCLFLTLSSVFYISVIQKSQQVTKQKITQIERQIALDLPLLDLSNELLKHSGNKDAVNSYIKTLNSYINSNDLKVVAIAPKGEILAPVNLHQITRSLSTNNGPVLVVFNVQQTDFTVSHLIYYFIFLVLSVLISFWVKFAFIKQSNKQSNNAQHQSIAEPTPLILIVDLNDKTLSSSCNTEQKVGLANKPLCFYLALVEYCTNNDDVALSHNKDVPEELLELANKYFYRLVELGHTVRKRPNFNNSLEKTLSEIRAALDEVLSESPEEKELYYPPKAYGEGSRSRLHSYGLANIKKGNIEIRGK